MNTKKSILPKQTSHESTAAIYKGKIIGGSLRVFFACILTVPMVSWAETIIDQNSAVRTGTWEQRNEGASGFTNTYNGGGTHFAFEGNAATATYSANLTPGLYSVEFWTPSREATPNGLLTVQQGANSTQFRMNQNDNTARWSGGWMSLGVYDFGAGNVDVILDNAGADGPKDNVGVATGAVRFARLEDGVTPFIADSNLGPVGSELEFYTETSGTWITSSNDAGMDGIHWGTNRLSNSPDAEAIFGNNMPLARGIYELDLTWAAGSNRTANALLTVVDGNNISHNFAINQKLDPSDFVLDGLLWDNIGTFDLDFAGGISEVRLSSADGDFLSADAMRLTLIPEPGTLMLVGVALGSLLLFRRRK